LIPLASIQSVNQPLLPFRQAALIKKKRQEKDAILKRQAVASSKKRKLETDSLETMLPPAQKTKVDSSPSEAETEPADDIEIESNTLDGDGTADSRLNDDSENDIEEIRRTFAPPLSRRPLPALLPEELLEDDDEDMSEQEGIVNGEKKQKQIHKRNLLAALGEKKIKDKRLGNTTFRVVEKRSEYLAPKVSANSKGLKEAWLQGRGKGGVVGANRRVFNKGFLGGRK
jgi:U3 small nucleolar RNA-associated protein 16